MLPGAAAAATPSLRPGRPIPIPGLQGPSATVLQKAAEDLAHGPAASPSPAARTTTKHQRHPCCIAQDRGFFPLPRERGTRFSLRGPWCWTAIPRRHMAADATGKPHGAPGGASPLSALRQSPSGKPAGKGAVNLGVVVASANGSGLIVQSTAPGGLAEMYGLERGDVITAVHGKPNPTSEDLKTASQGGFHPDSFSMQVAGGKSKLPYRFEILLPLAPPEVHFHGMLMERDFEAGLHVVTGVLQRSAAAKAGVRPGSCIRLIDGVLVGGMNDEDLRKLIFGGQGEAVVFGLQPPKMTSVSNFQFKRRRFVDTYQYVDDDAGSGDDCSYCDGWSDKQHDVFESDPVVTEWLRSNHPDQVAHSHPVDVPDFYDSQAAAEQAAQAQPGEVAIPSPAHQQREQAPSLLAGHAGHAQKTAFPPPLLVPPQRTDAETIVREKVEKAIRSSVAVFIDAERMRIEAETAQIELETENLQESVNAMMERLRVDSGGLDEGMELEQELMGIRHSIQFLMGSLGGTKQPKQPSAGSSEGKFSISKDAIQV